ncbi:hypothetical protein [Kitasatospora sp. NPDC058190]|uniref:hypothetical protein n=1 Tax=Kitasatospora sp. NPDC058190 TaxID=3346371 RepID=UPI0036DD8691
MAIRRGLVGLAAAGMVLAGGGAAQLAVAGPAAAQPPCHRSVMGPNTGGQVMCPNFEVFRAAVYCSHAGTAYTNYGNWVTAGNISDAWCNSGDKLQNSAYPLYSVSWEEG